MERIVLTGTFLNVSTVLVGGAVGALVGERLPERFRESAMHAIGLMTLLIGFQMALSTRSAIIVLGAVVVGAMLGEAARIDDGLEAFGDWVEARVMGLRGRAGSNRAEVVERSTSGESLFSKGFVTASLVFCVGPMTILGSFQDGLTGVYDTLAVKSVLDGFTAVALASSLGWGVTLSSLVVLVYQGALTMGAVWAKPLLTEAVVTEMTAAGGLLIVGIGMNILGITRIRVANMLPALLIAPLLVALAGK
ncbi:MAG: DUF554 domain-containing protein [Sphingomonadaceae bacterium]